MRERCREAEERAPSSTHITCTHMRRQSMGLLGIRQVADRIVALDAVGRDSLPLQEKPQQKQHGKGMVKALANCTDFACLREAHSLPRRATARFSFPHFMIIGRQVDGRAGEWLRGKYQL